MSEEPGSSVRSTRVTAGSQDADRLRARAVWMYYVEGQTQSDIARALGINRVAIVRALADAKRRNEVRITISAPLAELAGLEQGLQKQYGIARVIIAPVSDPTMEPTRQIAAAAGRFIGEEMRADLTVGVGWGRTLHACLPFIAGRTLKDFRVVSLLGGIAAARRFNPAEFAWQFAELFQGEGFLVPAPALVDSPETKHALLERCGLAEIFALADRLDIALLSVGGIEAITTSYRTGHISEAERRSLVEAGAVGDLLYNFLDADGNTVDHQVNTRAISVELETLLKTPERVLISGGEEKVKVLKSAIARIRPTTFITDEITAHMMLSAE